MRRVFATVFLVSLTFLITLSLAAEEITISGKITTAPQPGLGGLPIAGAMVELYAMSDINRQNPLQSLTSDADGIYTLAAAGLNGQYIVRASKSGFLTKELDIKVGAGYTTYPDLWLEAVDKPPVTIAHQHRRTAAVADDVWLQRIPDRAASV